MESDKALNFVAAQPNSGAYNMSAQDSDFASWIMMNGDLFPSTGNEKGSPNMLRYRSNSTAAVFEEPQADIPLQYPDEPVHALSTNATTPNKKAAKGKKGGNADATGDKKLDMKRERRLQKNREIARNCRKRKRERFEQLEEEVVKLRQYNKQLEMKLNQDKGGKSGNDIRRAEVKEMETLVQEGKGTSEDEAKLSQKLTMYKDLYSDFGRERMSQIQYHMDRLKSLLIPNQVSKMTLWSLQQEDDFYDEKTNQTTFGGGIWNMLCSELELTSEQKRGLIDMRHGIRKQRRNLAECLRILKELGSRVDTNLNHMTNQMTDVMSLITPTQQAKFLLWIEKNQACMHMLNNIWSTQQDDRLSTDGDDLSCTSSSSNMITGGSNSPPPFKKTSVSADDMAEALKASQKANTTITAPRKL